MTRSKQALVSSSSALCVKKQPLALRPQWVGTKFAKDKDIYREHLAGELLQASRVYSGP